MGKKLSRNFWSAIILSSILGQTKSLSCPADKILCRNGSECVYLYDICRNGQQCSDGSDENPEICKFWTDERGNCGRGNWLCNHYCRTIKEFCRISECVSKKDSRLCELVNSGTLGMYTETENTGMSLTEELVNLMQQSINLTSTSAWSCPMFYTRVENACLSFFSPAKIPWAEARQFCLSMGGDLLHTGDLISHEQFLKYIKSSQLTSSYWIGGRYDIDTDAWSWVNDDSAMPLGSPYWTIRHTSSCLPRSIPHSDPSSPPSPAHPGSPCYNYVQAPVNRSPGWCAAITYEYYHYLSDEKCEENMSPLCLYTGKPYKKD